MKRGRALTKLAAMHIVRSRLRGDLGELTDELVCGENGRVHDTTVSAMMGRSGCVGDVDVMCAES